MRVRPAVILVDNNKVLLLKYIYSGNEVYSLPGGNPDELETIEEALKRELKEELFLEIDVEKLTMVGETINESKNLTILHLVFTGSIKAGLPKINSEHTSAEECVWINVEDLHLKNLYPNVGQDIQRLITGTLVQPYLGRIAQNWV